MKSIILSPFHLNYQFGRFLDVFSPSSQWRLPFTSQVLYETADAKPHKMQIHGRRT
jgi:hypothetical protein